MTIEPYRNGGVTNSITQTFFKTFLKLLFPIKDPTIPLLNVAVGVLPVGSGNLLSLRLNMTQDVQSCVINLVMGNKRRMDLISIHDIEKDYRWILFSGGVYGI